jgi:Fe2+ transport system protein FeoA
MNTIVHARTNPAALVQRLHALGFTPAGAQQLLDGLVVSDSRDRRRLALVLGRLLGSHAIQVSGQDQRVAIRTQSGVVIDLEDDAA